MHGGGLLHGQLEPDLELFPKGRLTLPPRSGDLGGRQGFDGYPQIGTSALSRPGMLLEQVLLGARQPVSPLLGLAIGWNAVELNLKGLRLIGGPRPEVDVWCRRQGWKVLHLALLGGCFNVQLECKECVRPPGDSPVCGESRG